MCSGIILPLLPVSTLYHTIILFWTADVFKLAVSTEQFLLNLREFMITTWMLCSTALSWTAFCSTLFTAVVFLLLHITLKWPILLHPVHVSPYVGHCLRGWLLPQYQHVCFAGIPVCMCLLRLSLCTFFFYFVELLCFSKAVCDCGLGSLLLDPLCPGQYIFACDFFYFPLSL